MVKILVNDEGKGILINNKAVKAETGEKYGLTINDLLGDVDEDGEMQYINIQRDLEISGFVNLRSFAFNSKFRYARFNNHTVTFADLTRINGESTFTNCFSECSNLNSVSFPNLTVIDGSNVFSSAFSFSNLYSISFPKLERIMGQYNFQYAFRNCYITQISFPKLNFVGGISSFDNMFGNCSSLLNIYFPSLTTNSFIYSMNDFAYMMYDIGVSNVHKIHFPSNLEETISSLTGYPLFGGRSGYVELLFDLPATE